MLAFFILDYAQQGIERLTENCLRILRLSLRTAKGCIEISLLDHAAAVLQLAARYQDDLAHGTAALSAEHRALHDDLSCEYYLNRMALSWRQDRLDLAEHLFKKAIMARDIWTASTAEQFADLLYEIGRALSKQESTEESVNWFRKSAFVFELETLSDCNVSAAELKMTVMQALVKALLHVETPEALGEARSVLETIRSSFGAKLSCHLLEFDFHAHCPESSSEDMLQAILIMIQGVSLNDPSYRTIMRCIYDLKSKDTALAARALEHLLLSRVLATGREEWIEQVVTVRLWMLAPPGSATACDLAENLILSVDQAIDVPFSANATSMLHGVGVAAF